MFHIIVYSDTGRDMLRYECSKNPFEMRRNTIFDFMRENAFDAKTPALFPLWQICRAALEFLLEIKYNRPVLANKKIKHEGEKK